MNRHHVCKGRWDMIAELVIVALQIFTFLAVGSWQNGMFANFYFCAAASFCDFVARFFLYCGGTSARKHLPGKSPAKSFMIDTTKIPRHISAEGPGQCSFKWCPAYGLYELVRMAQLGEVCAELPKSISLPPTECPRDVSEDTMVCGTKRGRRISRRTFFAAKKGGFGSPCVWYVCHPQGKSKYLPPP